MLRVSPLVVVLFLVVAPPTWAVTNFACAPQGAHFATGTSEPVCTLDSATDTVRCTGTAIEGIGHTNATETLTLNASATVVCHNPGNDDVVEPHTTTATDTTSVGLVPTKNGRIVVSPLSDSITPQDVEAQFVCPNPNWREEATEVTITSYTYTLRFNGFGCDVLTVTGP
jgi:hypothetical protein